MFGELRAAVAKLNREGPRPNIPALEVSWPYDVMRNWHTQWPGIGRPGAYVFADADGTILYIGRASCGANVENRLGEHWRHARGRALEKRKASRRRVRALY